MTAVYHVVLALAHVLLVLSVLVTASLKLMHPLAFLVALVQELALRV
jgi:hypothetical protein